MQDTPVAYIRVDRQHAATASQALDHDLHAVTVSLATYLTFDQLIRLTTRQSYQDHHTWMQKTVDYLVKYGFTFKGLTGLLKRTDFNTARGAALPQMHAAIREVYPELSDFVRESHGKKLALRSCLRWNAMPASSRMRRTSVRAPSAGDRNTRS